MQVSNKNQNIHFQAIIPHNIDAQKARPLIRHLSSSSSRTFDDVVELYRIFLPELSREASNKAKGSKMPDTAIRAFHSRFLDIINHLGMNPTIETIINMLNRFQPPKESSEIVSRLQFSSDTKIQDEKELDEKYEQDLKNEMERFKTTELAQMRIDENKKYINNHSTRKNNTFPTINPVVY